MKNIRWQLRACKDGRYQVGQLIGQPEPDLIALASQVCGGPP